MTTALPLPPETWVDIETAQWVRLCQRRADLQQARGRELLEQSMRRWPANVRLARDAAGVVLVADDYCDGFETDVGQTQARLVSWLHGEPCEGADPPTEELIESLLAEAAPAATLRDDAWVVPPSDDCPVEIIVRRGPGGVLVKATVADLTDALPVAIDAIAEFVCRAHHALRFVRAEIDDRSASLASQAAANRLESDLVHALRAVSVGARLLVRETQALLRPELAEAYLKSVVSL